MLEQIKNGFYTGVGFSIALVISILFLRAWLISTDWEEAEIVLDPNDVTITGHREVLLADNYTVSGDLEFDDRSRYDDITVLIYVYQDGDFIMECSDYIFTEENSDHFSIECDLEVQNVPPGVTYDVRVAQATLADE
ncbi:MAG: hypothetical protein AAF699_17260 [Pseudomonadota bacterium]